MTKIQTSPEKVNKKNQLIIYTTTFAIFLLLKVKEEIIYGNDFIMGLQENSFWWKVAWWMCCAVQQILGYTLLLCIATRRVYNQLKLFVKSQFQHYQLILIISVYFSSINVSITMKVNVNWSGFHYEKHFTYFFMHRLFWSVLWSSLFLLILLIKHRHTKHLNLIPSTILRSTVLNLQLLTSPQHMLRKLNMTLIT